MEKNEIFIAGYAKLPQGITASELYTVIAVGMLVDYDDGTIYDVDCTLATDMAKQFVKRLVNGKNICDLESLEAAFNEKYFGSAKKALLSAIRIINEKYVNIKKEQLDELD